MPDPAGYVVREMGPEDWVSHRDLRLEMLQDSPTAFWATLDDAHLLTEAEWREELRGPRIHFQARAVDTEGQEIAGIPPAGGIALLPEGYTDEHVIDPRSVDRRLPVGASLTAWPWSLIGTVAGTR